MIIHTVPKELTEEERAQIIGTEEFSMFFDQSTRLVERALTEKIDLFTDYRGKGDEDGEGYVSNITTRLVFWGYRGS